MITSERLTARLYFTRMSLLEQPSGQALFKEVLLVETFVPKNADLAKMSLIEPNSVGKEVNGWIPSCDVDVL